MPQIDNLQFSPEKVKKLRRIAFLLDNSIPIPGTKYRFGLDPILGVLGIVGGSGDLIGGALGAYIVMEAAKMGLPERVVWQMVANIAIDSSVSLIPGIGDIFDVTWKANAKNIELLEEYLSVSPEATKSNPWFVASIVLVLAIIVLGFAFLTVTLIRLIFNL